MTFKKRRIDDDDDDDDDDGDDDYDEKSNRFGVCTLKNMAFRGDEGDNVEKELEIKLGVENKKKTGKSHHGKITSDKRKEWKSSKTPHKKGAGVKNKVSLNESQIV
jgi:hypothetical protein